MLGLERSEDTATAQAAGLNHKYHTCSVSVVSVAVLDKAPAVNVTHVAAPRLTPQQVKPTHALTKRQAHLPIKDVFGGGGGVEIWWTWLSENNKRERHERGTSARRLLQGPGPNKHQAVQKPDTAARGF